MTRTREENAADLAHEEESRERAVEHTPTPWRDGYSLNGEISLWDADGNNLLCGDSPIEMEQRQANAAFIVRAVNAHDELVAALRMLLLAPSLNEDAVDALDIEFMDKTRAALAKATGEQS